MANIQLVQCLECRMFIHSSSVISSSFICDMYSMLVSFLTEKTVALEVHIHTLERVNESQSDI